jgi:dihydroorotate dehydrogenase electron transfer subunit
MAPLIQEAHRSGIELSIVMSARTPDDLMKEQFLRGIENADVHCVFDSDNSSSMPSMDKLIRQLLSSKHHDMVYTCGSKRVLTLLQQVLKVFPDTQGEVALEQKMACGMGGCLSCVRPIMTDEKREYLRVCREGPVFPIANVVLEAF